MKKPNGFMYFTESRRNEYEKTAGKRLNTDEMIAIAANDWTKMSSAEQEKWKAESKRRINEQRGAMTSSQPPPKSFKRFKSREPSALEKSLSKPLIRTYFGPHEAHKFEQQRRRQRDDMWDRICWEQPQSIQFKHEQTTCEFHKYLIRRKFFLLSVTPYGELNNHEFPPAEVVISSFSIAEGFIKDTRFLVAHKYSPKNTDFYESAARENCGISYVAQGEGSIRLVVNGDYNKIVCSLMHHSKAESSVVGSHLHAPQIFVEAAQYNVAQGALAWLKNRRDAVTGRSTQSISTERVVCIEDLAAVLVRFVGSPDAPKPVFTLPSMDERKVVSSSTACDQHRRENANKCAQTRAKYVINDFLAFTREQFGLEHDTKALLPFEASLPSIDDSFEPSDYAASDDFDEQDVLIDPDLGLPIGVVRQLSLSDLNDNTVGADEMPPAASKAADGDRLSLDDSGESQVRMAQVQNWLANSASSEILEDPSAPVPYIHPKWLQVDFSSYKGWKEEYGRIEERPKCFGFGRGLRVSDSFLGIN